MPARWSDEHLEPLRSLGDPDADRVISDLFSHGDNVVHAVNALMRDLVENTDVPAGSLPAALRRFFEQGPPAWADPAKIARGQALFHRYGPLVILLLNTCALPMCYAARKGVQVLARTNRLHSNPQRRIVETAQMIVDVMSPGGLDPASDRGAGLRSAQKVRLMHATIRRLITRDPTWDPAWDVAINQEDLLGTLITFSALTLDGLQRLGVELDADELDAYMHTWNVVGALLGVREDILPRDYADALALGERIAARHFAACPEGQALTHALLAMFDRMVPGTLLDGVAAELVRHLVGDHVADLLAVPPAPADSPLLRMCRMFGRAGDAVGDRSSALADAAGLLSRALVQGLLLANRGGRRTPFHVPTELRQVWGVNWP